MYAQIVDNASLSIEQIPQRHDIQIPDTLFSSKLFSQPSSPYALSQTMFSSPTTNNITFSNPMSLHKMTYKVPTTSLILNITSWQGGQLIGTNNISYTSLVGYTANASIMAIHNLGNWTFEGSAELMKYGNMANTATFNGNISYHLSQNISATIFGIYQSPSFFSLYQTYSGYQYGGYITFQTNNEKWGIDLGARHAFNPWNGKQATIPIIMPYYKIGKTKLGIDFGGLLNRNGFNDGPPMFVPKPRPSLPIRR